MLTSPNVEYNANVMNFPLMWVKGFELSSTHTVIIPATL